MRQEKKPHSCLNLKGKQYIYKSLFLQTLGYILVAEHILDIWNFFTRKFFKNFRLRNWISHIVVFR
jgi:hypothetical protein